MRIAHNFFHNVKCSKNEHYLLNDMILRKEIGLLKVVYLGLFLVCFLFLNKKSRLKAALCI